MKPTEFSTLHADAYEAIEYFHGAGMIGNQSGDAYHFIDALVKFTAHKMHVELIAGDDVLTISDER
tara:strand:+ start:599 stop:796 length:198 start_codon:yes stop_codon:yes gene_type:complete